MREEVFTCLRHLDTNTSRLGAGGFATHTKATWHPSSSAACPPPPVPPQAHPLSGGASVLFVAPPHLIRASRVMGWASRVMGFLVAVHAQAPTLHAGLTCRALTTALPPTQRPRGTPPQALRAPPPPVPPRAHPLSGVPVYSLWHPQTL